MGDTRQKGKVRHEAATLMRQRVMALCAGWEDLNDAEELAQDPVHQLASGAEALGSAPTLSRFENAQNRASAWAVNEELVEQFIRSKPKAPAYLILDFDATDIPFMASRRAASSTGTTTVLLPAAVRLRRRTTAVAYLRPSNIDGARHAWAILALIVKRLKAAWPGRRSSSARTAVFAGSENAPLVRQNDVKYVVGLARNSRLLEAQRAR